MSQDEQRFHIFLTEHVCGGVRGLLSRITVYVARRFLMFFQSPGSPEPCREFDGSSRPYCSCGNVREAGDQTGNQAPLRVKSKKGTPSLLCHFAAGRFSLEVSAAAGKFLAPRCQGRTERGSMLHRRMWSWSMWKRPVWKRPVSKRPGEEGNHRPVDARCGSNTASREFLASLTACLACSKSAN